MSASLAAPRTLTPGCSRSKGEVKRLLAPTSIEVIDGAIIRETWAAAELTFVVGSVRRALNTSCSKVSCDPRGFIDRTSARIAEELDAEVKEPKGKSKRRLAEVRGSGRNRRAGAARRLVRDLPASRGDDDFDRRAAVGVTNMDGSLVLLSSSESGCPGDRMGSLKS